MNHVNEYMSLMCKKSLVGGKNSIISWRHVSDYLRRPNSFLLLQTVHPVCNDNITS